MTTQFVETTQLEVGTEDLGTTSDDDKRVQWNLQVNQIGEDEEQRSDEPQEVSYERLNYNLYRMFDNSVEKKNRSSQKM